MSNQRYEIDEEIEVTIKVKVKIKQISNYTHMNTNQIKSYVEDFKSNISDHIVNKITDNYFEEVEGCNVDYVEFDIEEIE